MSDDQLLHAMVAAAVEAGRAAFDIYQSDFDVQQKADASPVTSADHAAEAIILDRLRQHAPRLPVVAEEQVAAGNVPTHGDEFFLVDPLDGTKEFIRPARRLHRQHRLIRRGGMPALGVVYAPATGRAVRRRRGRGHALRAAHQDPD